MGKFVELVYTRCQNIHLTLTVGVLGGWANQVSKYMCCNYTSVMH